MTRVFWLRASVVVATAGIAASVAQGGWFAAGAVASQAILYRALEALDRVRAEREMSTIEKAAGF